MGRFVSMDPIGLRGGVNLYNYAISPTQWVDPAGLSPCHVTPITRNNARQLLRSRGLSKQQQHEITSSFDGQIHATQGRAGDQFLITESETGKASGCSLLAAPLEQRPLSAAVNWRFRRAIPQRSKTPFG